MFCRGYKTISRLTLTNTWGAFPGVLGVREGRELGTALQSKRGCSFKQQSYSMKTSLSVPSKGLFDSDQRGWYKKNNILRRPRCAYLDLGKETNGSLSGERDFFPEKKKKPVAFQQCNVYVVETVCTGKLSVCPIENKGKGGWVEVPGL